MALKQRSNADANPNNALKWTEDLKLIGCCPPSGLTFCQYKIDGVAKTTITASGNITGIQVAGTKYTFDTPVNPGGTDEAVAKALAQQISDVFENDIAGAVFDGGLRISATSTLITLQGWGTQGFYSHYSIDGLLDSAGALQSGQMTISNCV